MRRAIIAGSVLLAAAMCGSRIVAQQPAADGPRYTKAGELVRPADYREWVFLSSGLGMTYDPPAGLPPGSAARDPAFGNVFVNPSSYRAFMQTGKWPNGTTFILEGRRSATQGSINQGGRFQTELSGVEAEVKDSRFADGWAFFAFGAPPSMKESVSPLAGQALARGQCVECHTSHTAVERTFVQFYPTLLEVARRKGTINPGYDDVPAGARRP